MRENEIQMYTITKGYLAYNYWIMYDLHCLQAYVEMLKMLLRLAEIAGAWSA